MDLKNKEVLQKICKQKHKIVSEEIAFSHIRCGDHILVGTGCGEPRHLLKSFISYIKTNPKTILGAEIYQIWGLGDAPYTDETLQENIRHNSFFIGREVREAVNKGLADYTPISFSDIPEIIRRGLIPVDTVLIQTSPPDEEGYLSLGVSVDIMKTAVEKARLVIAQVNSNMPYTYGDGLIHADEVDYLILYDEPLTEYNPPTNTETAEKIAANLNRLIHDGETIQAGYGSLISYAVKGLKNKKNLGIHTELLSDGLVELIKSGAADNSRKTVNKGKTIASFCMGTHETYKFINKNPEIEMKTIDYTNNLNIIAAHDNMTSINTALGIDLTGQATEESVGRKFYGGIGGQANFMRGAVMSKNGKNILILESTAEDGTVSRITPFLPEGAGVTLNRGDVHYVVTEYGIAYLHGKNIRERAMELIAIAHPKFRQWLINEAKKHNLIYPDQVFIEGVGGIYPEEFETYRTTRTGLSLFIRPVKISDEHLLKDFFYSISEESMYHRFGSARKDMPHTRLKEYTSIDYRKRMVILAFTSIEDREELVGVAEYDVDEKEHTAEIAFLVKDGYQNKGVGSELLKHLTYIAKRKGFLGFTAEVSADNKPMTSLLEDSGFYIEKKLDKGTYNYRIMFRGIG